MTSSEPWPALAEEAGMDCVISTGDKDMAQLVSEHTTLTNTMTDRNGPGRREGEI